MALIPSATRIFHFDKETDALNRKSVNHYFSLLHDTLLTNGLLDKLLQKAGVFPFDPEALAISATADNHETKPQRSEGKTLTQSKALKTLAMTVEETFFDEVTEAVGPSCDYCNAHGQLSLAMATPQRQVKLPFVHD